jgi:hypothetical protein
MQVAVAHRSNQGTSTGRVPFSPLRAHTFPRGQVKQKEEEKAEKRTTAQHPGRIRESNRQPSPKLSAACWTVAFLHTSIAAPGQSINTALGASHSRIATCSWNR